MTRLKQVAAKIAAVAVSATLAISFSPSFASADDLSEDGYGLQDTLQALSESGDIKEYSGTDASQTAALQAYDAYPDGVDSAIIVNLGGASWMDALSATALAAYKGPILYSSGSEVPQATQDCLLDLGVDSFIVIGGTSAVPQSVCNTLTGIGLVQEDRISGQSAYDTNRAIYEYGVDKGYWSDTAIISTGNHFSDALSASPVAFAKHYPIILADGGDLNAAGKRMVAASGLKNFVIVGGSSAVNTLCEGFLEAVSYAAGGSVSRIWGDDQYATSTKIAQWAADSQGFNWSCPAISTGKSAWDAISGSVLQGSSSSVLLLADEGKYSTFDALEQASDQVQTIRFFGGTAALSTVLRGQAIARVFSVMYEDAGISLESFATMQHDQYAYYVSTYGYTDISYEGFLELLNPDSYSYGQSGYLQFAVIDEGYSGKVTAEQIDAFISSTSSGRSGMLAGQGEAFIEAAKTYDVNEVYLLAHAILESGWGTSALAMGYSYNGKTYYNFFGIEAVDSNALSGGRDGAVKYGWDSPRKAILGGAEWISEGIYSNGTLKGNYFNSEYNQNTLFKMKYNYVQAAKYGSISKQYATGPTWSSNIANLMYRFYDMHSMSFSDTGLRFLLPRYS